MTEPDYLFDRSGPADAEVARLEQLLGRFGHGRLRVRPRRPRWRWLLPALLAAAGVALLLWRPWVPVPASFAIVRGDGGTVAADGWIEASSGPERLTMANLGWMTLAEGGRLRVHRLDDEQGRFYLEHGSLEAFVMPSVRPRFLQVETAATTCVDLGCKYVLDVDPVTKRAHVQVTLGRVAFQDGGREVYVPRDAECTAEPGRGAGTPRFVACDPVLRAALDAFDAARGGEGRRAAAARVAAAAKTEPDTLPLWHLLADADAQVRATASSALVALVGPPRGGEGLEAWREHLESYWW